MTQRLGTRFCAILMGFAFMMLASPASRVAAAQAAASAPERKISVESSRQLFATMCALYAAGYQSEASTNNLPPAWARIGEQMLSQQGPATEALRKYYREHQLGDRGATLARYVSFALVAGPPPEFTYTLSHSELPPDVLAIEDFNDILAKFYLEAGIGRLYNELQPDYGQEIARFGGPVSNLLLVSTSYLRELLSARSPRTFTVDVEPLVGGDVNFRNYGDHYAIVVSPGDNLPLDVIRHAMLHFLLDPLAVRNRELVMAKKPLLDLAARAPRLPEQYKDDFLSFFTECLVRAVELRLRRLPAAQLARELTQDEEEGFVLVRPLNIELAKFEKAEPAMSFYFPDLVKGISVAEESKRLANIHYAPALPPGARAANFEGAGATAVSELERWLIEGDRQIAMQDASGAQKTFERVLSKYPGQPRALYGLAIALILQGQAERAKELFHRLVALPAEQEGAAPTGEARILAWSHVYLGRIYDVEGQRDLAKSEYRAALAVEGAPEAARVAAQRGVEKGYEPAKRNSGNDPRRP